jgi:hypothetical protein
MATIQTDFIAPLSKRLTKIFRDFYEGKFYDENGKRCEVDMPLKFGPLFVPPSSSYSSGGVTNNNDKDNERD